MATRTRPGWSARGRAGSSSMQFSQGLTTRRRPRNRSASDQDGIYIWDASASVVRFVEGGRSDERRVGQVGRVSVCLAYK
ncbi:uncharacterized protein LAESUDRAFT_730512 [Laetiporus sulphureus 93-53]|uniref:Uncharacterized protein n=1 Tax=Laetiporus sulphureus 93-53 TaxID=1314785 RepID=A0A165C4A7_9APHY|nr:uncharacterized protein LAESUDRAFT_730512 [Laetiporus sulphureus 93-53]KZT02180.1 hypothetical protein LAESUDRAFT_730512 [Laetiporus sulphureus 93-53]